MSKYNTKEKETTVLPGNHGDTVALLLNIGEWKNNFSEYHYKLLIARALNECVHNERMNIAGYLITKRRVCLVLRIEPGRLDKMLEAFYGRVRKELRVHEERMNLLYPGNRASKANMIPEELYVNPFKKYPLLNDYLVKLITGQKVELPYYNPHLARLKDHIHHYNFCSAIDHAGATGPVIVKFK
ncbi:MAG TPA: hypothetical protein VNY73_04375 [Bacteroidia bacterium]|jgi:hypothetical protein|nr:hypothetical protein [Bacteroidia bacterium]